MAVESTLGKCESGVFEMLWALALIGLVPAAFVLTDFDFGEDEGDAEAEATESDTETGSLGDMLGSGDEGSEEDTGAENTGPEETAPSETEIDPPETEAANVGDDSDGSGGVDTTVELGSGETLFEDFTVGEDHVTLSLTDGGTGAFSVETVRDEAGEEIGVSLTYTTETEDTTLTFLGHELIPVDDIMLEIPDAETGEPVLYALSEYGDFGAILPEDGDTPDNPGPEGGEGDAPTTLTDPETPDEPGPIGSEEDNVIAPEGKEEITTGTLTGETVTWTLSDDGETLTLSDDEMQGGTDAELTLSEDGVATIETEGTLNLVTGGAGNDVIATGDDAAIVDAGAGDDVIYGGDGTAALSGGAGNDTIHAGDDLKSSYVLSGDEGADRLFGGDSEDTLIMDMEDVAFGGAGADTFWITLDAGAGFAEITDFAQGEDVLRITLDPVEGATDAPTVEVQLTEDGSGSEVIVNGDVVAVLQGALEVSAEDIIVDVGATAA